jgi:outer membrane protein assembly factor BamB
MKRIRDIWAERTAVEQLLIALAAVAVVATCALAAVALVKRPEDISDPDADFRTGNLSKQSRPQREDRTVDWPRYGYDEARTKFLNVPKVRPPFRKLWKYEQDQLIEFAPILAGNRMYLIDNDGVFITLNNDTGKVVWKKRLGKLNASSPAVWRGMLLAVNLEPQQAMGIRARDGKVKWRRDLPGRSESSPLVRGKRMYFGTESGDFFALNAHNGKVIWQTKLEGAVKAAPSFAKGTLYVGDYAGKFYALRAEDGAIRWEASDLGGGLGRAGRFYSTPAVAFGRVYVGNVDGRVYSFDRQTGAIAWTHSAGDYVYSGIAAADGPRTKPAVYFGSHDRQVYSLDAKSGKVNWSVGAGGMVSGPATVIGDVVYVSTFSGNATVGFRLKTGRRVFKFDEGQYGPAVSDGERLYMVGGSEVIAFKPMNTERNYKPRNGTKGIVPPAERRRIRKLDRRGGGQAGAGNGGGANRAEGGSKEKGQSHKQDGKRAKRQRQ